tara:strand:- start:493 stop:633 length:141 start_codon:yes stop_codon:yes gene_type:complete
MQPESVGNTQNKNKQKDSAVQKSQESNKKEKQSLNPDQYYVEFNIV